MIGRFRVTNKISSNKMCRLWDRAFAILNREAAVTNAINNGFNEESRKIVTNRFEYLKSVIVTGHLKKMPRKKKKVVYRELMDRYNLCVIMLGIWDEFK